MGNSEEGNFPHQTWPVVRGRPGLLKSENRVRIASVEPKIMKEDHCLEQHCPKFTNCPKFADILASNHSAKVSAPRFKPIPKPFPLDLSFNDTLIREKNKEGLMKRVLSHVLPGFEALLHEL